MKIKPSMIFFAFLFITLPLWAQIPGEPLGDMQNPWGMKWQQLDTPHFRVIFPSEIDQDAQSVANTLEHIYHADAKTMTVLPRRISVLLHNRNTVSNGFVTLAPRRSEWFNTPPQVGLVHCVPWYDLLAVHEYRHVVQFDKTFSGFNRLFYYLMGEIGWAAGAGFSTPLWAWEGDAVVMETALTRGGRGRMPEFDMPMRTMLLSGKKYSYYKMTLGSYKNWIADPYAYGYFMNTYVRRHHGPLTWSAVWSNTSDFSFFPYRFSWALSRHTGKGSMKTHAAMLAELAGLWRRQSDGIPFTAAKRLNGDNDGFLTRYRYPQCAEDGSVIVYKDGFADQGAFVRVMPDGREQTLFHPNPTDGAPHSLVGNTLVWAETINDPRWGYQDFSVIKRYDLNSGKKTTLTRRSRYFAPALSPDGKTIAAVAYEKDNNCYLALIDANTGKTLRNLSNPENDFLMTPRWTSDGNKLLFNRLGKKGRALSLMDVNSHESRDLIAIGDTFSALPIQHDGYILYNGDFGGINHIFALNVETRKIFQVTTRPFGAFNPCISSDGKQLFFNDYDLEGYHLAAMAYDPSRWPAVDSLPDHHIRYYEPLLTQEAGADFLDHVPHQTYPIRPYSAWNHLFHPHSWTFNGDALTEAYGISLYSLNLLGTVQSQVGFQYNRNERNGHAKAGLSYGGLYPIFDFNGLYGARASTYLDERDSVRIYTWREQSLEWGVRLPLDLSRDGYRTALTFQAGMAYTYLSEISDAAGFAEDGNQTGWFRPVRYAVRFFRGRGAYADIMPVWGQTLQMSFRHTPLSGDYRGEAFTIQAAAYFPGITKRHGLRLGSAFERQGGGDYRFSSEFLFPRGYSYRAHDTFIKLTADYAFPLFYPDRPIWALFYLKRIKTNLFFDYGKGKDAVEKSLYRSVGAELITDVNVLSIIIPLQVGGRFSYCVDRKKWHLGLLLGLNL